MPQAHILADVLIFLAAGTLIAPIFQRLRSSLVLGYLVAGSAIGPRVLGLVENDERTTGIAELGVVALMFTIGLEITLDRLRVMRRHLFGLGTGQLVLAAAAIGGAAAMAGVSPRAAVILGGGLALSSTAVVLQILAERGELASRVGRVAFAVLLLQDLAVVPLLSLVPALAGPTQAIAGTVALTLAKAAAALAVIFIVGRLVLRPFLGLFKFGATPELFTGVMLLVLFGTSWGTAQFGLSLGIGGFVAGMLLAETEFRHQVAADIQPFRGLLLGLFFMTVGMSVDLDLIATRLGTVVGLTVALLAAKAAVTTLVARAEGIAWGPAINAGLLLGQGSEFTFVLLGAAVAAGLMDRALADMMVVVIALSLAATPLLATIGRRIETRLSARDGDSVERIAAESEELADHVIVGGFGRVGQSVARLLTAAEIPYVAFERDAARVAAARKLGLPVFYGDSSRIEMLRAGGAARARAAVIILDNATAAEAAVHAIRNNFPNVSTYVRGRDNRHLRRLEAVGATYVVHETYELSLQLGGRILRGMGTPEALSEEIVARHRADDYALLGDIVFAPEPEGGAPAPKPA
jgi:K+:H+ antiporter